MVKKKSFSLPTLKPKLRVVILLVAVLIGLLYYFRGQFIVAVVNGRPICRLTLIKELEKQGGKQTLEFLVTRTLILQEAKKENVTVGQEELDEAVKELEENLTKQGQTLGQFLEFQGMSEADLREQMRVQKLAEKIAGKDVVVSDEELEEYFEENKEFLPEDADEEEVKEDMRKRLEQQKSSEAIRSWIESLRENSQIKYLR